LTGLDGVLIGLRTREFLQQLLDARCSLSPVVMVIEDLHWIDSVSAELLGKIVDGENKLKLMLLTTHRPEFAPPWLDRAVVTQLHLEPLPVGDIRRLVQERLGAEVLPEALARQVAEKAEGNPLFAEEIVSFLTERGMLHAKGSKLEFDPGAVAAALPASAQSVLNARVDRLAPKDRLLLQAASVIGRRFNPELLAVAAGETEIDGRLAAMQALDLIHRDERSGDYKFKHALVRDALYHSILTERRQELHSKIAEELERRSSNRLAEVAEMLAHHYSQTNHTAKAFVYLSMAGSRSLGVYSLEEAANYFTAALALLDNNPHCASDDRVTEFLASYLRLLNLASRCKVLIDVVGRYLPRVDRIANDPKASFIRVGFFEALILNGRYREAVAMQRSSDTADRIFMLGAKLIVSTYILPMPRHEFELFKREALTLFSIDDVFFQTGVRWLIGLQELLRGRFNEARKSARELMQVGQSLNDPRSTGQGLTLLSWIAVGSGSYAEALEYGEQSLSVAITKNEQISASGAKAAALVLLGRIEEGARLLEEFHRRSDADGHIYVIDETEALLGVCKLFQGKLADAIHVLEKVISKAEKEGYRIRADRHRLALAEVYLQITAGGDVKVSLPTLLRNLPILLKVLFTANSRIRTLIALVLENPHFDPAGHYVGHAKMILGLLYKTKNKRALALEHLTEAKRILSQFGQTPILARVDTALAELSNSI
jgi:tetratricopeptide (TPR) repeat protein